MKIQRMQKREKTDWRGEWATEGRGVKCAIADYGYCSMNFDATAKYRCLAKKKKKKAAVSSLSESC